MWIYQYDDVYSACEKHLFMYKFMDEEEEEAFARNLRYGHWH